MHNPFQNNELCDGRHCGNRTQCARYMCNVDIDAPGVNFYVIFNKQPFNIGCPFRLDRNADSTNYPQKQQ